MKELAPLFPKKISKVTEDWPTFERSLEVRVGADGQLYANTPDGRRQVKAVLINGIPSIVYENNEGNLIGTHVPSLDSRIITRGHQALPKSLWSFKPKASSLQRGEEVSNEKSHLAM